MALWAVYFNSPLMVEADDEEEAYINAMNEAEIDQIEKVE